MRVVALLLMLFASSTSFNCRAESLEIISPKTGATALPGHPVVIRVDVRAISGPTRVVVTSDCTEPQGALRDVSGSQIVEFSLKWAKQLKRSNVCTINATAVSSGKDDVGLDASPVWVMPDRQLSKLRELVVSPEQHVGVGGCNILKATAFEQEGDGIDILLDERVTIKIADPSVVKYLGTGIFEGLKAGSTNIQVQFVDDREGSNVAAFTTMFVGGLANRQLCQSIP